MGIAKDLVHLRNSLSLYFFLVHPRDPYMYKWWGVIHRKSCLLPRFSIFCYTSCILHVFVHLSNLWLYPKKRSQWAKKHKKNYWTFSNSPRKLMLYPDLHLVNNYLSSITEKPWPFRFESQWIMGSPLYPSQLISSFCLRKVQIHDMWYYINFLVATWSTLPGSFK